MAVLTLLISLQAYYHPLQLIIEELISQYTGDVTAHQIGKAFRHLKDSAINNDGSLIGAIRDEITTVLVAPSRSKLFKGRVLINEKLISLYRYLENTN